MYVIIKFRDVCHPAVLYCHRCRDCESYIHPSCIVITMEMPSDKVVDKASQNVVEVQVSMNIAVSRVMKMLVHSIMGLYNNMDRTRYTATL